MLRYFTEKQRMAFSRALTLNEAFERRRAWIAGAVFGSVTYGRWHPSIDPEASPVEGYYERRPQPQEERFDIWNSSWDECLKTTSAWGPRWTPEDLIYVSDVHQGRDGMWRIPKDAYRFGLPTWECDGILLFPSRDDAVTAALAIDPCDECWEDTSPDGDLLCEGWMACAGVVEVVRDGDVLVAQPMEKIPLRGVDSSQGEIS